MQCKLLEVIKRRRNGGARGVVFSEIKYREIFKEARDIFFFLGDSHFKAGRIHFRFSFFSGMTRFLLCYVFRRAAYLPQNPPKSYGM